MAFILNRFDSDGNLKKEPEQKPKPDKHPLEIDTKPAWETDQFKKIQSSQNVFKTFLDSKKKNYHKKIF